MNRIKSVSEFKLPPNPQKHRDAVIKFSVSEETNTCLLGKLQDFSFNEETAYDEIRILSPPTSPRSPGSPQSPTSTSHMGSVSKSPRLYSILGALSPSTTKEVKKGKVKGYFPSPLSPTSTINAGDLIGAASASTISDDAEAGPSTSTSDMLPASPMQQTVNDDQLPFSVGAPQLLVTIDQVGGWPGRIMSPSGVDFLPNGHIVVVESDNRLQVFDRKGQSQRIIAWGKVSPVGVVVTRDGDIAVTDKRDKCVKIYSVEGDSLNTWGIGIFNAPCGIATTSCGNFVVADSDKHCISIHSSDGNMLSVFGSWGSGDYQFSSPSYVAVNKFDEIIVSDLCNSQIKIFGSSGKFRLKFTLGSSSNKTGQRPRGVCCDQFGNILVADRDNHRITLYNSQGTFTKHILMRPDIKFPWDLRVSNDGHIVLVETHNGFLSRDPHHAVKLFKVFNN